MTRPARKINHSILKMLLLLLGMLSAAILFSVSVAIVNHVQDQSQNNLRVAEAVLHDAYAQRENMLFNSASVLVADFGFKQAAMTGDSSTISSALQNHANRIEADLMALISLDGSLIASTLPKMNSIDSSTLFPLINSTISEGGQTVLLVIDNRAYQIMLLAVEAPNSIAVAAVGFELDLKFLLQISALTDLDVALVSADRDAGTFQLSTEKSLFPAIEKGNFDSKVSLRNLVYQPTGQYVLNQTQLSVEVLGGTQLTFVLGEKLSSLLGSFRWLQLQIASITLCFFVLAAVLGALISKKLTKPLEQFSKIVGRVAEGEYSTSLALPLASQEVLLLGKAVEHMQTSLKEREEHIMYQARHDLLTTALNRQSFKEIATETLNKRNRTQLLGFSVLGFRELNDTFGIEVADGCVKELAVRLLEQKGILGRLEGSQLLLLSQNVLEQNDIIVIRKTLEEPLRVNEMDLNVKIASASLELPVDANTADECLRRISISLDAAESLPSRYCSYVVGMENAYLKRLGILTELERALDMGGKGLSLNYQPKLDICSKRVEKVEALIRWNHERLGSIPPDEFIPIAEKAGLICQITDWVISRVTSDLAELHALGYSVSAAINLSVHDLMNEDLIEKIIYCLGKVKLPIDALAFEITESDLMSDPELAVSLLTSLKDNGFSLSIDDFGTGYSSLAYLKTMPVDELKIDKAFVMKLDSQGDDQKLVQSIIALANEFGLQTVAEGVENLRSLQILEKMGCDTAQGYFISKPMSKDALLGWLEEFGKDGMLEKRCVG